MGPILAPRALEKCTGHMPLSSGLLTCPTPWHRSGGGVTFFCYVCLSDFYLKFGIIQIGLELAAVNVQTRACYYRCLVPHEGLCIATLPVAE